nr:condensin-2 complex subunit D3 [Tanacetum cinerariifolium]
MTSIPLHPHGLLRTIRCAFKNRPLGPPSGKKKRGGGGRGKNKGESVQVEANQEFTSEILRCLSSSIIVSKSQARIFGLAFVAGKDENKIGLMKVMGFGEEGGINDVLRKRCVDEKAAMRKAALDWKFHDDNVTKKWLHSVPRLIADNETSIQEECENLFLELVLDRITRAGSNADLLERNQHEVLSLLKEICHGEVTPWVKKTAEEKKTRKIDHLARSIMIQGLLNEIYSLIDSNETAKDLWDTLERQMRGSEYGEQDKKAVILYEYETFKAIEGEQLLDTYLRYLNYIKTIL